MEYLITGYNGQLGFDLKKELLKDGVSEDEILIIDVDNMDITNKEEVFKIFSKYKPKYIFHCAAWTNVDLAEENYDLCYKVNVIGTKNIVDEAKKYGSKIVYISTDYVFDGTKKGLYEVSDKVNPQSVYGKTKYEGEELVRLYPKHFIIRTSWVFGINGKNFVKTMLNLADSGKTVLNVVADQFGSPTYTVDLAKELVMMMKTEKYGTYHVNNEGYCSWAEFAEYIFKTNNKDVKVNRITSEEYKTKAKRPLNSRLSKKSLDEASFDRLPTWEDAICRYNKELIKERK